jgi:hypothetical protein
MGHLLRWRELLKSASELTEIELPPARKRQLADILDRLERLAAEIEKGWAKSIIARAIALNIRDFVSKIRETRYATKS